MNYFSVVRRSFFAVAGAALFLASLLFSACPIKYESHDEWDCVAAKDAEPCQHDEDCNNDKLACRAGFCLDKTQPVHSICTSDGFFKPDSVGCAADEFLCSQYCVSADLVSEFAEFCCPDGCADDAKCCGLVGAKQASCVTGGCDCFEKQCPLGKTCCGGGCAILDSNAVHCGSCFHTCSGGTPVCQHSTCVDGRGNDCCGSSCDNCNFYQQVCLDGFCHDCTDAAQCGDQKSCVEQLDLDTSAGTCVASRRCKDLDSVALGGDCSEKACADDLLCVSRERYEDAGQPGVDAGPPVMQPQCLQSCASMEDCPMIAGTGCRQTSPCPGYCE